jgi:fatty-acyl-CoA synthase
LRKRETNVSDDLYRSCSLADLVVRAIHRFPDRTALVDRDGELTYREMGIKISQVAQALSALGLKRGDGIAQLAPNRSEVFLLTAAAYMLGLRVTSLHPLGAIDDHATILQDAEITALVVDAKIFGVTGRALETRVPSLRHVLSHGPSGPGTNIWAEASRYSPAPLAPMVTADDIAHLTYTGGTTGRPKGVVYRHGSLVINALIKLGEWDWPAVTRFLAVTPISHATGYMIIPVLLRGGTFVLEAAFSPQAFLLSVERHRITATFLVPTMIYGLLDHPETRQADRSSLELIIYGGAPTAPGRLREALGVFGPILMQHYGLVDAGPVTVLRKDEHDPTRPERLAACGTPYTGVQVALLGESGHEVSTREVGEICVRGPTVMDGYWRREGETAEAFRGGWLHTGDMAYRDEDGYLYIVDRRKEMIVSGGFNVFPREVEDVLASHPGVAMAAVIGVPDAKWGEAVKAIVVRKPGQDVSAEALIQLVRDRKGPVYAPKSVDFADTLPQTTLGKPDKHALRAPYWKGVQRQVH